MLLTTYCLLCHCFNYGTSSKDWFGFFSPVTCIRIVGALICQAGLFHFDITTVIASEETQLVFTPGSGKSIGVPRISS